MVEEKQQHSIIEKIIAAHLVNSDSEEERTIIAPGEIVDIKIDIRLARDFGGANVVKNLINHHLTIDNPKQTFFTFDCNPTGSDQKYAANQHYCRIFARENNIPVYDINAGIGTHLAIDEGLAVPGSTLVSTDSHANILGAIGAFGQGMGDQDIAAAWAYGHTWFKIPPSVKLVLEGNKPHHITAKDIALNLLAEFGSCQLLGHVVELYGKAIERLSLDDRITIASMATELGAIAILIPPNQEVLNYCADKSGKVCQSILADPHANYVKEFHINISKFEERVALPGEPHNTAPLHQVAGKRIDSVFIGSCTNGRYSDLKVAAEILRGHKIANHLILKIVPSNDETWKRCLKEGLFDIFKKAGALIGNAGCAGCAAGQIGQNGPGEVTVSTGNRNFAGKQGKGDVYLASPAVAAASAITGYLCSPNLSSQSIIPNRTSIKKESTAQKTPQASSQKTVPDTILEGRVWIIDINNIDTDMIYHNQHLAITDPEQMGQYAFGNLKGWENYAQKSEPGDIIITGANFGSGSSRQQAVDCFKSLGNQAILAKSFGAIYERNAINAALPVLKYENIDALELKNRDRIRINLKTGEIVNLENNKSSNLPAFSDVQLRIYLKGGLLAPATD